MLFLLSAIQKRYFFEKIVVICSCRNLEYLWLGPWRCLLLGERLDDGHLDGELDRLMVMLKDKYDFDAHEQLLNIILSGDLTPTQREECVSQFLLYRGYFGSGGSVGEKRWGLFSSFSMGVEDECEFLRQPFLDAMSKVEVKVTDRHPVVLVMEAGIQVRMVCVVLTFVWDINNCMSLFEVFIGLSSDASMGKLTCDEAARSIPYAVCWKYPCVA